MSKSKMVSLSENNGVSESPSKQVYYPSIRVSGKAFPGLKKMPVKTKIMLEVEAYISGYRTFGNGQEEATLELRKASMDKGKEESA